MTSRAEAEAAAVSGDLWLGSIKITEVLETTFKKAPYMYRVPVDFDAPAKPTQVVDDETPDLYAKTVVPASEGQPATSHDVEIARLLGDNARCRAENDRLIALLSEEKARLIALLTEAKYLARSLRPRLRPSDLGGRASLLADEIITR